MQYGSIDSILRVLEERGEAEGKQLLATAQQEADVLFDKLQKDGLDKLEQRKARFFEETGRKKELDMMRISMEQQKLVNRCKEELIDKALERTKEHFAALDEETFLNSIRRCLRKENLQDDVDFKEAGSGAELPTLYVPAAFLEAAQKSFALPVETRDGLDSGFILSFSDYDINQETNQLFQYNRQEFTRRMMQLLFSEQV